MDTIKAHKDKEKGVESSSIKKRAFVKQDINSNWYRAIVSSAMEGFWVINLNGDILDVNDAICRMTGYSRDELLSMNIKDIDVQLTKSPESLPENMAKAKEAGGALFESQQKRKDGSIIDILVSLKYLDTGNDLFFCFHRDITEEKLKQELESHKQTEEALEESEDRYRTLIELGNKIGEAVIMLQDIKGREYMHTYVSDQWPLITGYTRKELLGISFFDLISPQDRESSIKRYQQKISGKAMPELFELSIINKKGEEVPIELTGAVTTYRGKLAHVVYIRDITEKKRERVELEKYKAYLEDLVMERTKELEVKLKHQKQIEQYLITSEERYHSLFQDVPVAIFEIDYSGTRRYLEKLQSHGVKDLRNYLKTNAKQYIKCINLSKITNANQAALDLYEAEDLKELVKSFEKAFEGQEPYRQSAIDVHVNLAGGMDKFIIQEYVPTFKGNWQYHIVRYNKAPDNGKKLSRVLATVFDITYLKNIENKLQRVYREEKILREELERKEKQRQEFTRSLVHELKTPLMPMLGASEVLSRELHNEPYSSYAKVMYQGSRHLENRIDELLDIIRGEVGLLTLQSSYIKPLELLYEISEFMKAESIKHEQKVVIDLPSSMQPIYADYDRLHQVLMNIINNAFKFTPNKGSITIKALENDKYALFEVTDSGIGIDKETKKTLFEPYKTSSKRGNHSEGLGLGLSLCKMIVELHSGQIKVESEEHKGTRVCFKIPFAPDNAALNEPVLD